MSASWTARALVQAEFGEGVVDRLSQIATGDRVLLVTTAGFTRRGVVARLTDLLGDRLVGVFDRVAPNPDMGDLDAAACELRAQTPDMIVALGGGSVMDTAKVLALQLKMPAAWTLTDHFRNNLPLPQVDPLPLIAVPTTAGTGAEVTPFATVWDNTNEIKYSLSHPGLTPGWALLDPSLTLDLPLETTVSSGLDAVSQALESLWNRSSNPVSSAWATRSLQLSLPHLAPLSRNLTDLSLRSRMLEASYLAGLAISVTRTSISHSMSYPLTAHFGIPHGLACSFTLPAVLEFNAQADDGRLHAAATAFGRRNTTELMNALIALLKDVDAAGMISAYVHTPARMLDVAGEMITADRANNNMRAVSPSDISAILMRSIDLLWPTTANN